MFAEGQASVVAEAIIEAHAQAAPTAEYGGRGQCYLEFGNDEVAKVEVTFLTGQAPVGTFEPASAELAGQKTEFGSTRVRRWFGREWTPH